MHPIRKQRLYIVVTVLVISSISVGIILYVLRDNINLFYPPIAVATGEAPTGQQIRIGGMVLKGSITRKGLDIHFTLTDFNANVNVHFRGVPPDLFAEEQGAVVTGVLREDGVFIAQTILAKHDENYMPPEIKQLSRQ